MDGLVPQFGGFLFDQAGPVPINTASDPQRNTRRLLSPLALKRTLGVRLPSNLVIFNNKMGAATLLPLRMVG